MLWFRSERVRRTTAFLVLLGMLVFAIAQLGKPDNGSGPNVITTPTSLSGVPPGVTSVQFSPDGKLLAATGDTTGLWNVSDGKQLTTINDTRIAGFSPDSTKLAVVRLGASVDLVDVASTTTITPVGQYKGSAVFAFSQDSTTVAVASTLAANEDFDNPIALWDVKSGKQIRTLPGHVNGVQSMEFSKEGILASGAAGGQTRLWNVATGQSEATLAAGYIVAFSPDGKTLVTSSDFASDHKVQLWYVSARQLLRSFGAGAPVAFSQDGKQLLTTDRWNENPNAQLWDVGSATTITTVAGAAALSPDGKTLAQGRANGEVSLFDVGTRATTRTLTGHTGEITALAFSPDGKTLASASKDNSVRLWPIA